MNTKRHIFVLTSFFLAALAVMGCNSDAEPRSDKEVPKKEKRAAPKEADDGAPKDTPLPGEWKKAQLAPGLWLEREAKTDQRRVLVSAVVCLREGSYGLECLLCREGTKEHESILFTKVDARLIHAALEAAGAKAGSPVKFRPKFEAPTGNVVKVFLQYTEKGKTVVVPAQRWISNAKTKKDLEHDWIFAGSTLYDNENEPGKKWYGANVEGAYFSISNVETAVLDLPVSSPKSLDDRLFEPNTARIPALETKVTIILEPVVEKKKEEK